MKSHAFTFFLLSLLFLTAQTTFAQKTPIKFGKIDVEDMKMTHYPLDSSAHAVVLCDYGMANLEYNAQLGEFFVKFDRHIRIKIIDQAGYDYSNFEIPRYQDKNSNAEEKLLKFKAATYNLVNGYMEDIKVSRKDLFTEEVSENLILEKIAMPEIKEGTVFEIQYSIESPFTWNLYDWEFQQSIPTRYSEYYVSYPDWFDYKVNFKGYDYQYLTTNDSGTSMDRITYSYFKSRIGEHGIRDSDMRTENIDFIKKKLHYVAENMPAFVPENYSSAITNYLTALEFELAAVSFPNAPYENFTKTWDNVNDLLSKNENLGGQIGNLKVNSFKDEVSLLTAGKDDADSQIEAIYYHVREKIIWDKQSRIFASADIKKTYKEGKGNSADINLLLVAMLRADGFDAHPVAISTRSHGYLNEWFPARSQFNYLICAVKNDDDTYQLIDATDRSLPMNVLPPRCINGKGMMITKEGHIWLDLTPNNKYRHVRQVKATLTDDLIWTGTMNVKCKDYAARQMRQDYLTEGDEKSYVQMIQNENTGLNLTNPALEEMETMAKETKASYDMTLADNVMDGGEMLYFNPMLTFAVEENPFKLKDRKYPVDYNYPYEYIYSASFEIPENYAIEELPENLSLALPEKGGRFSYTMSANGNTINLTSQLKISKYLFLPEEYAGLKEFYNLLVDKMAAQVVLKKKE